MRRALLLLAFTSAACGVEDPAAKKSVTSTATATATAARTATATSTAVVTSTRTATGTSTATSTSSGPAGLVAFPGTALAARYDRAAHEIVVTPGGGACAVADYEVTLVIEACAESYPGQCGGQLFYPPRSGAPGCAEPSEYRLKVPAWVDDSSVSLPGENGAYVSVLVDKDGNLASFGKELVTAEFSQASYLASAHELTLVPDGALCGIGDYDLVAELADCSNAVPQACTLKLYREPLQGDGCAPPSPVKVKLPEEARGATLRLPGLNGSTLTVSTAAETAGLVRVDVAFKSATYDAAAGELVLDHGTGACGRDDYELKLTAKCSPLEIFPQQCTALFYGPEVQTLGCQAPRPFRVKVPADVRGSELAIPGLAGATLRLLID